MIAIADSHRGQFPTPTAMIEDMCRVATETLRRKGYAGAHLVSFDWHEEEGRPPQAVLVAGPGHGTLNAARCRAHLMDRRAAEAAREDLQ
jgi:hypothetical protein